MWCNMEQISLASFLVQDYTIETLFSLLEDTDIKYMLCVEFHWHSYPAKQLPSLDGHYSCGGN